MSGDWSEFVAPLTPEEKQSERRALSHSLGTMLLVMFVGFLPGILSVWNNFDCDRAANECRWSARFLGIPISTKRFPASSLRGARLIDKPSHDRGPWRHHWQIVIETTEQEWQLWTDADSYLDDELQRELSDVKSFISGTLPHYEFVSINGLNMVGLLFLLLVGAAGVRAAHLGVRLWRLR